MKRFSVGLFPACLMGSVLAALWFSTAIWLRFFTDNVFRYVDSGLPMLVEGDAYYHLYHAQQYLAGQGNAPLLSKLGATLSQLSRFPLENVAFWLPMLFAALTGLCVWGWSKRLTFQPWQGFLASSLAVLMPAYVVRVAPGRFDTDGGIALLWHICLLLTARLSLPRNALSTDSQQRVRNKNVCLMMALFGTGLLLGAFWLPGLIVLPLCLWIWGMTFDMEPHLPLRRIRKTCAWLIPVAGLIVLALPEALLPQAVAQIRLAALNHLFLAFGFKDALTSINELRTLSPSDVLSMLGVYPLAGAFVLLALVLAIYRHARIMVFFLPSGLALVAGVFSARFLYLAALPLALCVALLPTTLPWAAQRLFRHLSRRFLQHTGGVLAIVLTLCAVLWPWLEAPRPVYNGGLDYMAQKIRTQAIPGAKLWNWWDEGYFLQARTGLAPLFDGGSQSEDHLIPAAFPLACSDPLLARRWMRFFAVHGIQAAYAMRQSWGSWENVQHHLSSVLMAKDPHAALIALPPVTGLNLTNSDALLPPGQIWLYLPAPFMLYSHIWEQGEQRKTNTHDSLFLVTIPKHTLQGEVFAGKPAVLTTPTGPLHVNTVIDVSQTPLTTARLLTAKPPYLITHKDSPWWHLAGERGALAVGFRLLASWGTPVPGFREVFFHPGVGGVWEVLP